MESFLLDSRAVAEILEIKVVWEVLGIKRIRYKYFFLCNVGISVGVVFY